MQYVTAKNERWQQQFDTIVGSLNSYLQAYTIVKKQTDIVVVRIDPTWSHRSIGWIDP